MYEPEWVGHELLYAQAQNSDMLWTDFCHKLQDQTLTPLTAYQQQFPDIRVSVCVCNGRLIVVVVVVYGLPRQEGRGSIPTSS